MKILGIPVKIDQSFLIICALLAYSRISQPIYLVEWLIVIFVSILIHELGHALVVRSYGLSPQITLYSMGGLTSWRDEKGVSHAKHIAISLAGPFAGFVFGGLVYLSERVLPDLFANEFGRQTYFDLLFVNLGWGIFNLLPILPLDGGNVAHSIEQWVTKRPGGAITRAVSLVIAVAVGLLALSVRELWVVFLMALFALNNGGALFKMIQSKRDGGLRPALDQAQQAVKDNDGATAVQKAKEALSSARSLEMKEEAQRILLQGLILGNDYEQARKEADRLQAVYGHEALLLALTGFDRDQLPRAISVIEYSYETAPSPDLNFVFANALILAGRLQEAAPLIGRQQHPEYAAALYKTLQAAAFHSGDYGLSAEAGRQAFERSKDPEVAYNVACADARAGRADDALAWIERAVEAGYRDVDAMSSDSDLAVLRSRPEFETICGRLRRA
ncbi:MAG TPA: site-2 protease family protein [Blastocatellia bacterium]|nr:site-2 protease family protein [Blastocatellia bacterium]